jgi:uncharacterized protein (TIGR02266 family)
VLYCAHPFGIGLLLQQHTNLCRNRCGDIKTGGMMNLLQKHRRPIRVLVGDAGDLAGELKNAFPQHEQIEMEKAASVEALLAMVQSQEPDLVVIDLNMAGLEHARGGSRIKTHPALQSTPVILILPHDRPTFLAEHPDVDCDAVIARPIDRQRLWQTVGHLLNVASRVMPRAAVRLRIHFGVGAPTLLTDYSVNLSTGGVFIETLEPIDIETPLTLEFSLPGNPHKIRCHGRVAWVNTADQPLSQALPPGIGVQFLDLNLEDLRALRAFLAKSIVQASW